MTQREELEGGIAALEAQRAVLGDAVVDTALAALRARLARLGLPEQQLKPVTILFADVVESTRLSRRLEPEDVQAVMDGALRRFTSIVESERGRVFQYAGDGLLAVFGPVWAREDDPEGAVRAGIAILREAKRLALDIQARHGQDVFNVRVGIHTGPVLLGGGVDAEGSIRGIAVNIAARMEQTAPAGGLRISRTTYRHVRGLFDLAILREAKRLALDIQARHGQDVFNVRVGIHTGPVLLGGGVDAEGSIRGIAVNIAARMEQTAPAGGLRISRTTYRHVRGLFDV